MTILALPRPAETEYAVSYRDHGDGVPTVVPVGGPDAQDELIADLRDSRGITGIPVTRTVTPWAAPIEAGAEVRYHGVHVEMHGTYTVTEPCMCPKHYRSAEGCAGHWRIRRDGRGLGHVPAAHLTVAGVAL